MALSRAAVAVTVLFLAACTQGTEASQKQYNECSPSPSSQPTEALGTMIGSGPGRPVLNSQDGEIEFAPPNDHDFKGDLGGNKILWAVAPRTGRVTVRGHEVGGDGLVRFGSGQQPKAKLVLAASSEATDWSDFPGYTRVAKPGCYEFEVTSPSGTEQIVFRFV